LVLADGVLETLRRSSPALRAQVRRALRELLEDPTEDRVRKWALNFKDYIVLETPTFRLVYGLEDDGTVLKVVKIIPTG
jgi:mRNA-degrading endonuclease RelE of RelBE toxin-antitoxin system